MGDVAVRTFPSGVKVSQDRQLRTWGIECNAGKKYGVIVGDGETGSLPGMRDAVIDLGRESIESDPMQSYDLLRIMYFMDDGVMLPDAANAQEATNALLAVVEAGKVKV
jgi:hypothetical protein